MQVFILLHHKNSSQKGFKLIVRRGEKISFPSQTVNLREKKKWKVSLLNTLNPPPGGVEAVVDPGKMGKLMSSPHPVETSRVTAPPQCEGEKKGIFKLKWLKPAKPDTFPTSPPASVKLLRTKGKKNLVFSTIINNTIYAYGKIYI